MPATQVQITVDCAEPERLARFWSEALGYVIPPGPGRYAGWEGYNRAVASVQHLAALEAECARLVALGASPVQMLHADGYDESCLVMQDPEGNELCLD